MEKKDYQPRDHGSKLGIGKRSKHGDKPTGNPDYQRHCHWASPERQIQPKRYFKVVPDTRYLSKRPVGDTKIPLPIIVPTINEMPLKRPTVRFNSNGASVSLGRECLVFFCCQFMANLVKSSAESLLPLFLSVLSSDSCIWKQFRSKSLAFVMSMGDVQLCMRR